MKEAAEYLLLTTLREDDARILKEARTLIALRDAVEETSRALKVLGKGKALVKGTVEAGKFIAAVERLRGVLQIVFPG